MVCKDIAKQYYSSFMVYFNEIPIASPFVEKLRLLPFPSARQAFFIQYIVLLCRIVCYIVGN